MERTNVFLGDVDRTRISELQERYGLASAGAAIRLALRLATAGSQDSPQSEERRPKRRRRPTTGTEGGEG